MKMQLENIQRQVSELFYHQFEKYTGGLNLSRPHIPLISEAYLKNRIVIIGQETNTWYRQGDDDLYNFYLQNYDASNPYYGTEPYREFIRDSAGAYPGKFWEFAKKLYDKGLIEGPLQKDGFLGHCWINLFAVEAVPEKGSKVGCPTSNSKLAAEIAALQNHLLLDLFQILKPKMIIALTGQSLDPMLFNKSLGLSWEGDMRWSPVDSAGVLECHELAEVAILVKEHPLFGVKLVRAYHPSYFMGKINSSKKLSARLATVADHVNPSQYYQNTLSKWIDEKIQN
jgi:hypothetical protein